MTLLNIEKTLGDLTARYAGSRIDLWAGFIDLVNARQVVEVGVFRGQFAKAILGRCEGISRYYMIDPWRNLEGWEKPLNVSDDEFAKAHREALETSQAWAEKRIVLRGKTSEVIDRIPDGSLDLAYIDGDHTLRGIAVDLIKCYPKVRDGGWIGGDDFTPSIWQHPREYEPSLVFPFAVHFAEAVDARIFALPGEQFLIEKRAGQRFEFCDLVGDYGDVSLRGQVSRDPA